MRRWRSLNGAARLYGAAEAAFERLGARIQAGDLADYQRGLAAVPALIKPARFDALWTGGRAKGIEQVIVYALAADDAG